MSVRLEPIFLANVLLFIKNYRIVELFPFISKNCQKAMLTLKTNPLMMFESPQNIVNFFPNINTMVVFSLHYFRENDTLPDTVTAIVVSHVVYDDLTPSELRYADRVVEIRNFHAYQDTLDLRVFPRLERLCLFDLPDILSDHKLKKVRIFLKKDEIDPSQDLHFDWAEQVVLVTNSEEAFVMTKPLRIPPHVHVFCSDIGESVTPEEFYPWPHYNGTITVSDRFGLDQLRAFNEELPIPLRILTFVSRQVC